MRVLAHVTTASWWIAAGSATLSRHPQCPMHRPARMRHAGYARLLTVSAHVRAAPRCERLHDDSWLQTTEGAPLGPSRPFRRHRAGSPATTKAHAQKQGGARPGDGVGLHVGLQPVEHVQVGLLQVVQKRARRALRQQPHHPVPGTPLTLLALGPVGCTHSVSSPATPTLEGPSQLSARACRPHTPPQALQQRSPALVSSPPFVAPGRDLTRGRWASHGTPAALQPFAEQ